MICLRPQPESRALRDLVLQRVVETHRCGATRQSATRIRAEGDAEPRVPPKTDGLPSNVVLRPGGGIDHGRNLVRHPDSRRVRACSLRQQR